MMHGANFDNLWESTRQATSQCEGRAAFKLTLMSTLLSTFPQDQRHANQALQRGCLTVSFVIVC
jgi:hypothetical protein